MQSRIKKVFKVFMVIVLCIIAVVFVLWGGLNLLKFAIYKDYYNVKQSVCVNPGLNDGFVCQGICAYESSEGDKFLVSGYMNDDSPSRIYVTNLQNESYYVNVKNLDDTDFFGHAGGIAVNNNTVYVASDDCINIISLDQLLGSKNGDTVKIVEKIPVNNSASFIFADSDYLYVGEFHNGKKYVTNHPYTSLEGENFAIVSRYSYENLLSPNRIYSIRDKVQGFCRFSSGEVVLSTSYGLTDSIYYVYNENNAVDSGLILDGAPVYYFNQPEKTIKGPAMAEGLDVYNGKVITLTESASSKYIFGKFFFANKIEALDFLKSDE